MSQKRPFRVYGEGVVLLFYSQLSLGKWLSRYVYTIEEVMRPGSSLSLRIELPSGEVAGVAFLEECLAHYRHVECNELETSWSGLLSFGRYRKRRGCGVCYMRQILHTGAERRAHSLVLDEEGEPVVRGARRPSNLPTAYDDLHRVKQRTWKNFRLTQWKNNNPSPRHLLRTIGKKGKFD